ncbi:MAG TPA: HemK2/MTQ2 family protein methyltransferase [Streptosporangiaceae bacterium]|nr:HemK2/MTQ2 family protein methyltransferase [Streptosporangiaceae bacterium]
MWNLKGTGLTRFEIAPPGSPAGVIRVLTIPGVFRPWDDSALLVEALSAAGLRPGSEVLDLCTGSGLLSIVAARLGAASVTAVDISGAAVICARLNALLHHASVRTRRGDLYSALGAGESFDAIVCNPPWRPSAIDELPTRGISRAWDAGRNARALIDRVCADAPGRLRPGGFLLIVQASFCDVPATVRRLAGHGLDVSVVARHAAPTTQLDDLAQGLQELGPWATGDQTYEIVVIRASKHQT